jgi:hypothetical protein
MTNYQNTMNAPAAKQYWPGHPGPNAFVLPLSQISAKSCGLEFEFKRWEFVVVDPDAPLDDGCSRCPPSEAPT